MRGEIFILKDNNELLKMKEQKYDSEDLIQALLEDYPDLISGSQINPAFPRRWLLIKREMGIPDKVEGEERWALDHLFLDQDAIPTLVEVKRSTDTRIRRKVVAQMLDYAANSAQYWEIKDIIAAFHETCFKKEMDPDQVMSHFLGATNKQEDFWKLVHANIRQGKIRMLFIADSIPPELQRIVEFLNEQMNPAEVLAMEIKQYAGHNLKTMVSRIIGQTMKAIDVKVSRSGELKMWDKESVLEQIFLLKGGNIQTIAEKLISWCEKSGYIVRYGKGAKEGSVNLGCFREPNFFIKFFDIQAGKLWIPFDYLKTCPPFDTMEYRRDLINQLNKVNGFSFKEDKLDTWSASEMDGLMDTLEFDKFCAIFEWIDQVIKQDIKQLES